MLRAVVCVLTGALVVAAAHADVYRYKDEKGNIQYTDRPQTLPAERLSVQSSRSDIVELEERQEAEKQATADRAQSREQTQKSNAERRKAEQTNAGSKAEACAKARQEYLTRMSAQRLYEEDSKGERRYLSDAELDATRAAAKTAMDTLCN
jgi:hypothetical protein